MERSSFDAVSIEVSDDFSSYEDGLSHDFQILQNVHDRLVEQLASSASSEAGTPTVNDHPASAIDPHTMPDATLVTVKAQLENLKAYVSFDCREMHVQAILKQPQMTEFDELLAQDAANRDLLTLKIELLATIETKEKAIRYLSSPANVPESFGHDIQRVLGKADVLHDSTNVLHEKTNYLSGKTDHLHEMTDNLHEQTNSLHSKVDILEGKIDSGLIESTAIHENIDDVYAEVKEVIPGLDECQHKLNRLGTFMIDNVVKKLDGISNQVGTLENKFSKVDRLDDKTSGLQEALAAQHVILGDCDGPFHCFGKLRDQVTEIQKSTMMLELESDNLHGAMEAHVTKQTERICSRMEDLEGQLEGIQLMANNLDSLETRMARLDQKADSLAGMEKKFDCLLGLDQKFDSLAGIEQKLDGLLGLEQKLDSLASLHEKLDSFAGLHEKVSKVELLLSQQSIEGKFS